MMSQNLNNDVAAEEIQYVNKSYRNAASKSLNKK